MLIVIEGIDGAGKSTVLGLLGLALEQAGVPVVTAREPGSTDLSERLRGLIFDTPNLSPVAEVMLFQAARAQLMYEVVLPALDAGKVVLLDRFTYSTLAYQGGGRGHNVGQLQVLNAMAGYRKSADMVLWLQVDREVAMQRLSGQKLNRLDQEADEFYDRVLESYTDQCSRQPDRWRVVDASRPVDEVVYDCLVHIASKLNRPLLSEVKFISDAGRLGDEEDA